MKVIVNSISAKKGGIITYTRNLMRSLMARNVDVTFALSETVPLEAEAPALYFSVDRISPIRRALWEQTVWRRIVARHKPDILYSSANFGVLAPPVPQVLLVREGGLFDPYYLSTVAPRLDVNGVLQRLARRRLIIASARASAQVITPTGGMKDLLVRWADDLKGRVRLNPYGTIPDFFDAAAWRRQWKEDGVLRLICVSAYYPHKQPGLIAEAVAMLNAAGTPAHLTLTMDLNPIADAPGGSQDHLLLSKGTERGQVTMAGDVPYEELPDLYRCHDLFVFPSLSESFGHPLTEAMATGTPIVAADTPVHREVCKDAALYHQPLSASDLARQVGRLDADEGLRRQMVAQGRRYVASDYEWEAHVDRLLACFEEVMAAR